MSRQSSFVLPVASVVAVVALAACGADRSDTTITTGPGAQGQRIVNSSGCVACHGVGGVGGMGPAWKGLYMSEVQLDDGTTVVADEQYLTRSITEPSAQRRPGYVAMPANNLSPDQVAAVVEYITLLK